MKAKKGYIKGMVQDNTSSKFPEESYYKLNNFRVVTEEGSSLGSIENEKGHILGFEIPDIPETTYGSGEDSFTIPAQNNLRIVGWTTVNDLIIVATTNNTSKDPINSASQIWAFTFDENNGEIVNGLPNNVLDIDQHLIYNRKLNLSTEYRVKMLGRYENIDTIRVYFTDNYNPLRTLNIKDPDIQLVEPNLLDTTADVNFIQPVIESVGNGNLPERVQVQATYRLISNIGAVSLYAPPTPLLPLVEEAYDAPLTLFSGDGDQNSFTKSATFSFTNLDTRYDVIEFVLIVYNDFNVATIYKVDEASIPDTGNITKTYSDIDTASIIPIELYNMLSSGFQIAKDIEVKDNLLLAANTRSLSSILEFDARCYRWSPSGYAKIEDVSNNVDLFIDTSNNIYDNIANPNIGNWEDIPENHDAINPYNKDDSVNYVDWKNNKQYKFRKDLTTLGGEGPNLSYKFVTETCVASTKMPDFPLPSGGSLFRDGNAPHLNVGTSPGITLDTGIEIDSLGTLQQYGTNGQYFNFASHTYNCYFAGHTRGETYRYGICFHDKKGAVKFVNWIGDIRIPDPSDGFDLMSKTNTHGIDSDFPWLRTLGIEFTVDVSSIVNEISGFSFVRVLRDSKNRTRLGSGMLMWFETRFNNVPGGSVLHYGNSTNYEDDIWTAFRKSRGLSVSRETTSELKLYGGSQERTTIVRESVGWGSASDSWGTPNKRCTTYLVSPLGRELPVDHKPNDYIKTSGYYISRCHNFGWESGSNQNDSKVGFIYMLSLIDGDSPQSYTHDEELIYIKYAKSLDNGEVVEAGTLNSFMQDYGLNDRIVNAGLGVIAGGISNFNTYTPFGIGAKKLFMLLDKDTPSDPGFINPVTDMELYNTAEQRTFAQNPDAVHRLPLWESSQGEDNNYFSTGLSPFKEVQYCRFIDNQYGGNTFSARSQNQYYFIGHFQPFIEGKTNYTNKVFYGDTYVNYYDQELTVSYTNEDMLSPNPFELPDKERNLLTTTVICPVESPINTEFRRKQQFSKRRNSEHIYAPTFNYSLTSYYLVYLNNDSITNKYFAPDFIQTGSDEHPNRVWYSNIKVNGEFQDNWRTFLPANYREVDGVFGEINKIINWRGEIYFYQNRGLGKLLINERSLIQDSTGTQLSLGTGTGISDHSYISNDTGSVHQYGVTKSVSALYHYDARLKKVYRFNGQNLEAISDTKGMSAFFDNEIVGNIVNTDKTLSELNQGPIGIEATFDYRYNRVIFTFLGNSKIKEYNSTNEFFQGDYIYDPNTSIIYEATVDFSYVEDIKSLIDSGIIKTLNAKNQGFTITFNEMLNAWESYYDFIPEMYLQYGRRLISRSPFEPNKGYIHNQGEYGSYYGQAPFNSSLLTTLGIHGDYTKIFNNIEYYAQVSKDGVDIPLETFNEIRVYNDYQDTGLQENISNSLIKRRMRTWRYIIQRDSLSSNNRARIRNPWTFLELNYQNNDNKKHIVHDITYSFMPSRD